MIEIGETDIGAIQSIDESNPRPEEEIPYLGGGDKPKVVLHPPEAQEIGINVLLHKKTYSDDVSVVEKRAEIRRLLDSKWQDNTFDYLEWVGYLSVQDISLPLDSDEVNMIRGSITARYLPYPEYEGNVSPINDSV